MLNYVDDVTLAGPCEEVHQIIQSIQHLENDIGYYLNPRKCLVCIPNGRLKPDFLENIGTGTHTWFTTMGIPVAGTIELQRMINQEFLAEATRELNNFCWNDIDAHAGFTLLRISGGLPKINHFLRCVPSTNQIRNLQQ